MGSRSRTYPFVGVSLLAAMIGGCDTDPTTMTRVPSNGPYPQAVDERTGVLAVMVRSEPDLHTVRMGLNYRF